MRTRGSRGAVGGSNQRGREDHPDDAGRDDKRDDEYDEYDDHGDDDEDDDDYDDDYEELSPMEAARAAARHIAQLTSRELSGVVSLDRSEDGWTVGVEVVEDRRIPSSSDILGLYEIEVGPDGDLLSYRRSRRYARGRADRDEVV